jgi:hypothetical protein
MGKFEDRLWTELVREHGRDLAQIAKPPRRSARRPRSRLLLGTTVGLAGLGTALALVLSAASSSPAFAVTRNPDGTVTVWVTRVGGILGANARLAELGVHARAVQVTAGCTPARANWIARNAKVQRVLTPGRMQALIVKARFDPKRIPAGHTLVLAAARAGLAPSVAPVHLVRGPAPGCFPLAPPPLPPGILRGSKGGQVHCSIVGPGWAAGKIRVVRPSIVARDGHVTVTRVPWRRTLVPRQVLAKGMIPPQALLAARAGRMCAAARTASRAARH